LGDIQHLVDGLEPIISIKGIYWIGVSGRVVAYELSMLVHWWWRCWGPCGGSWFCCACRFWIVAVRFWISCICAVKNCCIVGSIADSSGGGGTWFSWLVLWARITGGISCPAPDLVFTIWLLGKRYFRKEVELIKMKRNGLRLKFQL
jgi:hypothetical protein